jgi:hypothetical protein
MKGLKEASDLSIEGFGGRFFKMGPVLIKESPVSRRLANVGLRFGLI